MRILQEHTSSHVMGDRRGYWRHRLGLGESSPEDVLAVSLKGASDGGPRRRLKPPKAAIGQTGIVAHSSAASVARTDNSSSFEGQKTSEKEES